MPTLTLYHTSDILSGEIRKLLTARTNSIEYLDSGEGAINGNTVTWNSDIIIRHAGGSETTIASGIAAVTRSSDGIGIQSNTYNLGNNVTLASDDVIKIVERLTDGTHTYTREFRSATAAVLNIGTLTAGTWTFNRYTERAYDAFEQAVLHYNTSTADTKVTFNYEIPGSNQTVEAARIESSSVVFEPEIVPGDVTIEAERVESAAIFFEPEVVLVSGEQTIEPQRIEASSIVFEPEVVLGAAPGGGGSCDLSEVLAELAAIKAEVLTIRKIMTNTLYRISVNGNSEQWGVLDDDNASLFLTFWRNKSTKRREKGT